ncbi:MAG: sugar phosphate isomerase/epimerase [Desulfobacterales bacterium]|nr:MAG: sugar phosphate isomerase/epimerase [Desulfobacterales bacterium]
MQKLIQQIQVNIPFTMLYDTYLDLFLQHGLNPEIGIDAKALERFSFSDFRYIAEKLHARSPTITLHGPFLDLAPGSLDPAIKALTKHRFEQMLELVALFKPRAVVCHAGYDSKRYAFHRLAWIENSLDLWTWLGAAVHAQGATLLLENVYEDGPEEMLILFERLKQQHIKFCLDTGHLAAFGQASLENWLTSLEPFLGQIHLHDNHGNWDDHLALGHGNIDFRYLFDFLKSKRSKPPIITLEPHEEEAFWPSLEYLEKIWPW